MTIRTKALTILGIYGAGLALAVTALPLKLPEICLFKRCTGLPCCTCGMTHAFCALAHGHVDQAFNFNIASLPLAVLFALAAGLILAEAFTNKSYFRPLWQKYSDFLIRTAFPVLALAWTINLLRVFIH